MVPFIILLVTLLMEMIFEAYILRNAMDGLCAEECTMLIHKKKTKTNAYPFSSVIWLEQSMKSIIFSKKGGDFPAFSNSYNPLIHAAILALTAASYSLPILLNDASGRICAFLVRASTSCKNVPRLLPCVEKNATFAP